jgi:Uma2 family endonuclease
MDRAAQRDTDWTAEDFLAATQSRFGDAWRYELIDGRIVAHAAPAPDHGAIVAGLAAALASRLRGHADSCRPEVGSGAAPRQQLRPTARIPDATIRCGDLPRVMFEVVSPSELTHWRARDRKRADLQDVAGVQEIVEFYQDDLAVHVHRRLDDGRWSFTAIGGAAAVLELTSVGLSLPLREIYEFVAPGED